MKNHDFLPQLILSQILLLFLVLISTMAADSSSSEAKVHIVYTERPEGQDPEEYHIKTLTSVLGSEDAAKEALVYSYKHAASGFSAKLTPEQVSQLSSSTEGKPCDPSAKKAISLLINGHQRLNLSILKDSPRCTTHGFLHPFKTLSHPGVLQVVPSKTLQLHSGHGNTRV